jgi:hypothetical protein
MNGMSGNSPYHICPGRDVLIVTYGCCAKSGQSPSLRSEHKELSFLTLAEVGDLTIPADCQRSIQSWFTYLAATGQHT